MCVLQGEHYSASCGKVKDRVGRREVLRREGRCFLCLSSGHHVSDCSSSRQCQHCGRRHHQSLCGQNLSRQGSDGNPQSLSPPATQGNTLPPSPDDGTQTVGDASLQTSVTASRNAKTRVLLQTARAYAYMADSELIPIRALLDSGSQRSYMTNSLKTQLKLTPVRKERITLNMFGSNSFSKKECDMIEVRLQGRKDSTVTIVALSFPMICAPLPSPVEVDQYPHLRELELADQRLDHNDYGENIDILIGSDFYWDVVTGDRIQAENGPVAVSSVSGWLVSGPISVTADGECYTTSNLIVQGSDTGELGESCELNL